MGKTTTTARMHRDGSLRRTLPNGTEQPIPLSPIRPVTDAEITAAALSDPDAQPLTPDGIARMRPVPRTKTLRRALGLTQEEFALRFQMPLGTLRDWEQGRGEPDQTAKAYLKAIAGDAEAVQRALQAAAEHQLSVIGVS